MAGSVAGITLPEGDPAAIFDAAASLGGAAGAFEDSSRTVGGAVAQLGGWQGMASQSFRVLAAGYEQAGARAAAVVREAAIAVRGYGVRFEDAYEAVKRLQREAEVCVDEIERWERRRADAADREAAARTRAADAVLGAGLDLSGGALAAQAQAFRDADAAATDRAVAERKLTALRDELEDLRKRAAVERERAEEAESVAAGQVQSAAAGLPAVLSPGGGAPSPVLGWGVGPAVYRGGARIGDGVYRGGATNRMADFDIGDILDFSRDVDREMGPVDEVINDGVEKAQGAGREVLGINDAERALEDFRNGDIFGGLLNSALASPFGKIGKGAKAAKEVGEEGLEQLAKRGTKAAPGPGFVPPAVRKSASGEATNGRYTIRSGYQARHTTGSTTDGKSQFLFRVDADQAVLDAAAYADEAGLWVNNRAKVLVENGPVGVLGRSGEQTTYINLYRTASGRVHGAPGSPP